MRDVATRFREQVRVDDASGCWVWQGFKDVQGYGRFKCAGRTVLAHRMAYALFVGDTEGILLDHVCCNPSCVNPQHLRPLSKRENTLRGVAPSAQNARKGKCVRGHPFDSENTYYTPTGSRQCRRCGAARSRAYKERKVVTA